jgi:hypothetical protein
MQLVQNFSVKTPTVNNSSITTVSLRIKGELYYPDVWEIEKQNYKQDSKQKKALILKQRSDKEIIL